MAIGRTFKQAFAKAMRSRELDVTPSFDGDLLARLRVALARPLRADLRGGPARALRGGDRARARRSTPGSWPRWRRSRAGRTPRRASSARSRRWTPARRSSRPRRPTTTRAGSAEPSHEVRRGDRAAVVILGSGPNRIGQGIEFDYCCVHAAMTVRESGRDAVMINCNPETVSTDYDTSDRLYFEPLTLEDVLGVIELERPEGVIVQFGGQTPLKLAAGLADGRGSAARHPGGVDPPGRGSPELRRAARRARPARAALRHRASPPRRRSRWPTASATRCWCGPRTCSAAGPWRSATRGGPGRLPRAHQRRRRAANDLPRPLPRERHRGRRGRPVRRRGGADRRDHAARRGGGGALRGLGLRDPGDVARPRDARAGRARRPRRSRLRLGRDRPDEHPVRRLRRRGAVRDRGQPARLAHGAVRVQGDRRAAGQARVPADARRAPAREIGLDVPSARRATCRSRRRCSLRALPARRRRARPRDEVDRRGDGRGPRLPDRVRQGPGGRRERSCPSRARCSSA